MTVSSTAGRAFLRPLLVMHQQVPPPLAAPDVRVRTGEDVRVRTVRCTGLHLRQMYGSSHLCAVPSAFFRMLFLASRFHGPAKPLWLTATPMVSRCLLQ